MKTLAELRKLDVAKLLAELKNAQTEAFKVKFEVNNGNSKNSHILKNWKKQIAQIKTIMVEKGMEAEMTKEIEEKVDSSE